METPPKPTRDYYATYLSMVRNAVGTQMFRNWWVSTPGEGKFDAMQDGDTSCAFFVSGLLAILGAVRAAHGTVDSTLKDLEESGWQLVASEPPQEGDVLVWEAQQFGERAMRHIGFYVGSEQAISTDWQKKCVGQHHYTYDGQRQIEQIFRYSWANHAENTSHGE